MAPKKAGSGASTWELSPQMCIRDGKCKEWVVVPVEQDVDHKVIEINTQVSWLHVALCGTSCRGVPPEASNAIMAFTEKMRVIGEDLLMTRADSDT